MKPLYLHIKPGENRKFIPEVFIVVSLFILNPLLSLVTAFALTLVKNNRFFEKLLAVVVSSFLSLLNVTKILESDLLTYQERFLMAGKYSFFDYLQIFNREYIYYAGSYFFYYLTEGAWKLFVFLTSFLAYYLIFKSVIKLSSRITLKKNYLVIIIFSIASFYPLFSYSAHLIRNFIAASIILYFLIAYLFEDKNKWWLLIIAILIHTSSVLFVITYFIPRRFNLKNLGKLILITFGLLLLILFADTYTSFSQNLYVVKRINGFLNTRTEEDYSQFLYLIIFFFYFIFFFKKIMTYNQFRNIHNGLKTFFLIYILIIFFAIAANFLSPLMTERILMYIYFLSSILIALSLKLHGSKYTLFRFLLPTILFSYFSYKYTEGVWQYTSVNNLWKFSFFHYFF